MIDIFNNKLKDKICLITIIDFKKTLHILCVHKQEQQIDVNDHQQITSMQIKGILIMADYK
jgi:hypothetical protein